MSIRFETMQAVGKSLPKPKSQGDYESICEGLAVVLATVMQNHCRKANNPAVVEAAATNAFNAAKETIELGSN